MSLAAKLRRAPGRIAAGSYILNSGLGKLKGDQATATAIHGQAAGAYPVLHKVQPSVFLKGLAVGEVVVGAALLAPIVPAGLAGIALTGFAGSLLGFYIRTPGVHDKYLRPTPGGIALAKDVWLAGIGIGLVIDAALSESPVTRTD